MTLIITAMAITAADMVNASIIMISTSHIVRREVYTEILIRQGDLSVFFLIFLVLDQNMTIII